jgi:hypothetical protein
VKIVSKHIFFSLWEAGVLGNRTRLWRDPQEAFFWGRDECSRLGCPINHPQIGFREIGKSGGGKWEKVYWADVLDTAAQWIREGRKFIMDDGVPSERSVMQGEICRTYRGLESFLAVGHGLPPMRQSIAQGLHRPYGYVATRVILDQYMDPSSRDDLEMFLELYPDATIELACFDVEVGNIPHRRVMFWEVRDY